MELIVEQRNKDTEVGVIPAEWNSIQIQKLIDEKALIGHMDGNHGALYPRSNEFIDYGVPYVSANDFIDGTVNFNTCKFVSTERAKQFQKGFAQDGDVLFAHNATVGPVALLKTNLATVILSTTATYYRTNPGKLINRYLVYALGCVTLTVSAGV